MQDKSEIKKFRIFFFVFFVMLVIFLILILEYNIGKHVDKLQKIAKKIINKFRVLIAVKINCFNSIFFNLHKFKNFLTILFYFARGYIHKIILKINFLHTPYKHLFYQSNSFRIMINLYLIILFCFTSSKVRDIFIVIFTYFFCRN